MEPGTDPLVSVVVPAFNSEVHLLHCLESLLTSQRPALEVMVVNDASTDGTKAIVEAMATRDARVRPVHLAANAGVHAARARGLACARGRFIGFVDADDWVDPGMFARLSDTAANEAADIVICGATCAHAPGELTEPKVAFVGRTVFTDGLVERFARLEFGSGVLWNKLFAREVIMPAALLPLERAVDAAEDYIVNFGAFATARRVVTLPESLYYYRLDPASATRRVGRAASFCRTVRAYVVCLEAHARDRRELAGSIDALYARQLRFESYAVESLAELAPHREHLAESLRRLAVIHPEGVYPLVHAFDLPRSPAPVAVRPAVRQLGSALTGVGRALRRRWAGKH